MTKSTEESIILLNKEFYNTIAKYWNNDPNYFWQGWYKLLPYLHQKIDTGNNVKILDLGCGNGRFLAFVYSQFPNANNIEYIGVDNAAHVKIDLTFYPSIRSNFLNRDLLKSDWDLGQSFDIVVAFGIIHHIPGERLLQNFFVNLEKTMSAGSLGVITTWQYMRLERLQKRILTSKDRANLLEKLDIVESELREGDNFLDWIKGSYGIRFSHYFEEKEVLRILEQRKLIVSDIFLEDDRKQNRNQYFVIKKAPKII
jgi:tRNA (uracil-5-)-methyltransferase TRM9